MGKFAGWLIVVGVCVGCGSLPTPAQEKNPDKVTFTGKWTGPWSNNVGSKGTETYEFVEDENGKITGTEDEGRGPMKLVGERLGKDTLRFEVKHGDDTYRFIGQMEGDELHLHYFGRSSKTGEQWYGMSRQKRAK
jgi:hypothetical protein